MKTQHSNSYKFTKVFTLQNNEINFKPVPRYVQELFFTHHFKNVKPLKRTKLLYIIKIMHHYITYRVEAKSKGWLLRKWP